jgi:hypothetical protein
VEEESREPLPVGPKVAAIASELRILILAVDQAAAAVQQSEAALAGVEVAEGGSWDGTEQAGVPGYTVAAAHPS